MKWMRWLLMLVSLCLAGFAVLMGFYRLPTAFALFFACAICAWPWLMRADVPAGKVYGIPYYIDFDGSRHYFRANVYGYQATAPHENAIKEVIFRRLTQAIAHRAVDRVIERLK